ncbi:MAG: acetylornithine carbamoyltransferase [Bacteroidetes bacterium]|nr:acetylornithine carbamoyltransferase [Bacteroidota bacterium]
MNQFTSVTDVANIKSFVKEALKLKSDPLAFSKLGKNKTLGLLFLNPSLRTRLSTQKAAMNLGMNVMVMNMDKDGWALEMQDDVIMNGSTVEHIKDAAAVIGTYCDIVGIRSFPGLKNKAEDYNEETLSRFIKYAKVPVISLESATLHPLQSFADLITIEENRKKNKKPKVVLTWAPHIKSLPQAVSNSFAEWMNNADVDFVITHPKGYELDKKFTGKAAILHDQDEALKGADFVYVKNWSSYSDYGKILSSGEGWMLTNKKLEQTNKAKVMHCLPVRRGLELAHEVIDGPNSLILQQAENRVYAAQAVLKNMLKK